MSPATGNVPVVDPRRSFKPGPVNEAAELAYLRAGTDPPWERPRRDGEDITERPELQTPYEHADDCGDSRGR